MKKRVLLIAPYIHDFAAYDLWLKPLGLLYIASAAEAAGYEIHVVNCLNRLHPKAKGSRADQDGRGKFSHETIEKPQCLATVPREYKRYGIPLDAFREDLSKLPSPDVIGIGSMMTYWSGGVAETISVTKELFPQTKVILGGIYATLCPEHAQEHSGADIVIKGPGEDKFLDVLENIMGKPECEDTRSGFVRPAYHLLGAIDSVSMLTSFGCPLSCAYCASRQLRRRFSQRPVTDILGEITHYVCEMKIRDIAFYDDALLINPETHIKPILRGILANKLDVRLHTPNGLHANMIDIELADLMKRSGFATVRLSVESIDKKRLQDSCAKVSPEGFESATANLFKAGYVAGEIEAYVLMGAPGQSFDETERTARLVHENGVIVRLADFSPIPGTDYFQDSIDQYGLDLSEPFLHNSSALPHFAPGLFDQYQKLKSLAKSLNADLKRQHQ